MITKQFLEKEYSKNKKSMNTIGLEIGYDSKTIYWYLKKYGIKIRTRSEAQKGLKRKKHKSNCLCMFCKAKRGETKGKNNSQFKYGKYCKDKKYHCIDCGKKISISSGGNGQGRCGSCANKITSLKKWQNKEYRNKTLKSILKSFDLKPNKPEKLLNKLLQQILPKEYKFVGDGNFWIVGFCPDFVNVNGQKKIIEMYGDYWHNRKDNKQRDKLRLKTYNKYGYKTLIIWEHELKDLEILIAKIMEFNYESKNC